MSGRPQRFALVGVGQAELGVPNSLVIVAIGVSGDTPQVDEDIAIAPVLQTGRRVRTTDRLPSPNPHFE